jgi:hypothetical protein
VHKKIGGMLALTRFSLDAANKSKTANTIHVTNAHMRAATDSLHAANEQMHATDYYTQAGSLPPVGTQATDVDRAHALVEHATKKDYGALPKYVKLGRGGNSKLENTQETFERVAQLNREMSQGKHPGLSRYLGKEVERRLKEGTLKGGAEYGPTNPGPMTVGNRDMGSAFDTIGFAGARPTSLGAGITPGDSRNLVKDKKVNFVYVHPDAIPANAKIAQHNVTGQRWAFVDGKPVAKLPKDSDKKLVPFGQHVGQKVVDANGREVPHLNDKGKPLSFKELVRAGAMHTTVQDINPAPRSKSAPAEAPEATPGPRNWDTLPPRKRAAIRTRRANEAAGASDQISEIDKTLDDRQAFVDHAWALHQEEQKTKQAAKDAAGPATPRTSRKKKTDEEAVAEAALLGITRRGAKK